MACFRPLTAFQAYDGAPLRFIDTKDVRYQFDPKGRELKVPCGDCVGCRLQRSRAWALRCMHEAQCHEANSFVTLTYDDEHYSPSLNYRDFQLFLKKLRKQTSGVVRYFVSGEYGSKTFRPHFHALLFGVRFPNLIPIRPNLYRSTCLESLWTFGFSSIGSVTYESAGYVASYCLKKVNGPTRDDHYKRVDLRTGEVVSITPEFARMSLKPGIGAEWFAKYWREVALARDGVVLPGGRKVSVPKYYDKLLLEMDGDLKEFNDFNRYINSTKFRDDCTPERLFAREVCALSNISRKERGL